MCRNYESLLLKVYRHSSNSLLPNLIHPMAKIYPMAKQKLDTINVFAIVLIGVIPKGKND